MTWVFIPDIFKQNFFILTGILIGTLLGWDLAHYSHKKKFISKTVPQIINHPTPAPIIVSPKAPHYTGTLLEKRFAMYDQLFEILNSNSQLALNDAIQTTNAFPYEIKNQGPQRYAERIQTTIKNIGDSFVELGKVVRRYEYFSDINQSMGQKFQIQAPLYNSGGEFYNAVLALPDSPSDKTISLINDKREKFQQAVLNFARWMDETKEFIKTGIKNDSLNN